MLTERATARMWSNSSLPEGLRKNGGSSIMQSAPELSMSFARSMAAMVECGVQEMTEFRPSLRHSSTVTPISFSHSASVSL